MSYSQEDRFLICSKYFVEKLTYRQILNVFHTFNFDKYKTLGTGTLSHTLNRVRDKWDELANADKIRPLARVINDLKKTVLTSF